MYKPKINYTPKQEQEGRKRVKDIKEFYSKKSPDGNWRNWLDEELSEEELFNSEISLIVFYGSCSKLGYDSQDDIRDALKRGKIPKKTIEAALIYKAGLHNMYHPDIHEGYRERLHPEALEILEKRLAKIRKPGVFFGFVSQFKELKKALKERKIDPRVIDTVLTQKMGEVAEDSGFPLDEVVRCCKEAEEE